MVPYDISCDHLWPQFLVGHFGVTAASLDHTLVGLVVFLPPLPTPKRLLFKRFKKKSAAATGIAINPRKQGFYKYGAQ